jgi:hypothetical protein
MGEFLQDMVRMQCNAYFARVTLHTPFDESPWHIDALYVVYEKGTQVINKHRCGMYQCCWYICCGWWS